MKELRIMHCVTDEKFIDDMIEMTKELWTGCYQEYIYIKDTKEECKYIHRKDDVVHLRKNAVIKHIKACGINTIILHNIYSMPFLILASIPSEINVVWFAWGYDIYGKLYNCLDALIPVKLYHNETLNFLRTEYKRIIRRKVIVTLKYPFRYFLRKAISRVNYFSGVLPIEYDMIKANPQNSFFHALPLEFNYSSVNDYYSLNRIDDPIVEGFDIQVGNSCDVSNNHLDILSILKKINLNGKKIYAPLSYAGFARYREKVIEKGRTLFSDNFCPLKTFIPFDEYRKIMESTRYAIFYMERQQAMGNIYQSLWRGCHVFLSESNPAYKFLKQQGIKLFTIQNDLTMIEHNEYLSVEEIIQNRRCLIKLCSLDSERIKANTILNSLRNSLK